MSVRILQGDCRDVLKTLPDASAQCCVTSPPYFGLRDYGTGSWEGGAPDCPHVRIKCGERSGLDGGHYQSRQIYRAECAACGAVRVDQQIGLELTPDEYVAEMVAVFREVRRVLRDDGTLWLNIGDSYAGSWGAQGHREASATDTSWHGSQIRNHPKRASGTGTIREAGLKPKDLIGIPWMLAFALRADGWYLRQDIVWHKPNPMPESVRDRCTKAHEYVFLLSKSARYFYDADALSEECLEPRGPGNIRPTRQIPGQRESGDNANIRGSLHKVGPRETRNARSVWTVATQPFSEAHFATMAPDLAERCIRAGSRQGDMVLDPFGGAGTTGLVADRLQRKATLVELNPEYVEIARRRLRADAGMFAEVA